MTEKVLKKLDRCPEKQIEKSQYEPLPCQYFIYLPILAFSGTKICYTHNYVLPKVRYLPRILKFGMLSIDWKNATPNLKAWTALDPLQIQVYNTKVSWFTTFPGCDFSKQNRYTSFWVENDDYNLTTAWHNGNQFAALVFLLQRCS